MSRFRLETLTSRSWTLRLIHSPHEYIDIGPSWCLGVDTAGNERGLISRSSLGRATMVIRALISSPAEQRDGSPPRDDRLPIECFERKRVTAPEPFHPQTIATESSGSTFLPLEKKNARQPSLFCKHENSCFVSCSCSFDQEGGTNGRHQTPAKQRSYLACIIANT